MANPFEQGTDFYYWYESLPESGGGTTKNLVRYEADRYGLKSVSQNYSSQAAGAKNAYAKSNLDKLTKQILDQGTTSQWSGEGFGSAEANARDMARIMADAGITDIKQFGNVKKYEPVQQVGFTYNGQTVQNPRPGLYYVQEPAYDGEGGLYWNRRDLSAEESKQVKPVYGVVTGYDEWMQPTYNTNIDQSSVTTRDGKLVAVTGETFGNKETGKAFPVTYASDPTAWGGTYAGKGNTGYRVQFAPDGTPYFYTTGASSSDLGSIAPLLGLGLMFVPGLQGLGASIGTALGASGTAAAALGNAIIQGTLAEAQGGDFLKGAVAGAAGSLVPGVQSGIAETLGGSAAANIAAGALTGGTMAELTGGDFTQGALVGGIGSGINQAKLSAAEDYLQSLPTEGYNVATAPTEADVLDVIARETPSFTVDYSLPAPAPVISDMGAQGIQVPRISEVVDVLSQPIDYSLSAPAPQTGIQVPTINEIIDFLQPVDYSLPAPAPTIGIQAPEIEVAPPPAPFVPVDTTFQPDYSLSVGAPVIPEMGAQGIQVPTIDEVIDVLQPDYSLPIPDSGLGLTMPTTPNIDAMGGGQGITVPVSGGTLTESGVIPVDYTPVLGDHNSFINQPPPNVEISIPEVVQQQPAQEPAAQEQPKDISSTLAVMDLVKSLVPAAVSAALANEAAKSQQEEGPTGFPIVPVPSDWRSPEYNMAFTPSAPIDFGTRELLRGTQWESPSVQAPNAYTLSNLINTLNYQSQPFVQNVSAIPQAPMQMPEILDVFRTPNTVGINDTIGNLNGNPVSIADIIAGIQSGQNYSG